MALSLVPLTTDESQIKPWPGTLHCVIGQEILLSQPGV